MHRHAATCCHHVSASQRAVGRTYRASLEGRGGSAGVGAAGSVGEGQLIVCSVIVGGGHSCWCWATHRVSYACHGVMCYQCYNNHYSTPVISTFYYVSYIYRSSLLHIFRRALSQPKYFMHLTSILVYYYDYYQPSVRE